MTRSVGFVSHSSFLEHDAGPGHPERPERLQAIEDALRQSGAWARLRHLGPEPVPRDVLELVHTASFVSSIERACREGPTPLDPDTLASPGSWDAALRAAGAAALAVDQVVDGGCSAVFCAVRPPGHHAYPETAMGFCLFNNVAVGVRYAQRRRGVGRVLIVDWDVHHGNGTQTIFYDDPSVLYFSVHQHPFYPGTGFPQERGHGPGTSATINVPLAAGSGDGEAEEAFRNILCPAADAFRPELVMISAGFDGHRDDPLGGLDLTEAGYASMTRIVRDLADRHCRGRIVSMLEGGYALPALGRSVEAHIGELIDHGVVSRVTWDTRFPSEAGG